MATTRRLRCGCLRLTVSIGEGEMPKVTLTVRLGDRRYRTSAIATKALQGSLVHRLLTSLFLAHPELAAAADRDGDTPILVADT